MRIGEVGALSPAADLLTFSLAVVLSLGLVSALQASFDDVDDEDDDITEMVSHLMDLDGLDPDNDGAVNVAALDGIRIGPKEQKGTWRVAFNWSGGEKEFLIEEGTMLEDRARYRIVSVITSVVVIIETPEGNYPGSMSVCRVEVIGHED